ncbi:hypothetical protein FGO68_gene10619 [Halteria grandinella]|uniref:Uncharacterized protein n=1 Tax=Halteria grandinella TaxID=5974 RepID=A0A8J8NXU3_HALGN|nr:hypothetical protein FGO68_gene10619 [Halteria grandinella]
MASIIPNRPPGTPFLQIFAAGSSIPQKSYLNQPRTIAAMPGPSARLIERNNPDSLKVTSTKEFAPEFYNPRTYLKPFESAKRSQSTARVPKQSGGGLINPPSIMSLHQAHVEIQKLAVKQQLQQQANVQQARIVDRRDQYSSLKESQSASKPLQEQEAQPARKRLQSAKAGSVVAQAHNYLSQNPNSFYSSRRCLMNGSDENSKSLYQFTVPDYLRPLDKHQRNGTTHATEDNKTVTVISRINGWITVDAKTLNRQDALEKRPKGDVKKPSLMAPQWMQTTGVRDEKRYNAFKVASTNAVGGAMRIEKNRVILTDKEDLPKSLFNAGSVRHNFIQAPEQVYKTARNITEKPVRLIEWTETPAPMVSQIQRMREARRTIAAKVGHEND